MVVADEEEVTGPRDESRRHPELHRPDARLTRSRLLDERLHRERGACGAFLVELAVEEEEQRVAAELEHVPAVAPSDLDQTGVAPADQGDQLLGSELPAFGEPLRECREARDVEAEQRRVEDLCDLVAPIPLPGCGQARDERPEGRSGRSGHTSLHPERVRQFERAIDPRRR